MGMLELLQQRRDLDHHVNLRVLRDNVESTGAWTYTLDNSDAQTDALDGGDQVTETITVTATANGQSASHDVVITVNGANDLPTSSSRICIHDGGHPSHVR